MKDGFKSYNSLVQNSFHVKKTVCKEILKKFVLGKTVCICKEVLKKVVQEETVCKEVLEKVDQDAIQDKTTA